jgi:MFS family permease
MLQCSFRIAAIRAGRSIFFGGTTAVRGKADTDRSARDFRSRPEVDINFERLYVYSEAIAAGDDGMAMRWRMLVVLIFARLALGLSFQAAGSASPYFSQQFGMSLSDVGVLVGAFMLPGIFFALPAGMLGARFGDKLMVIIGFLLMAAGLALSGVSSTWPMVVLGRVLTGLGAVLPLILMVKMVFDWFVGTRDLFIAMSLFIIGWPVGHAIGQALLTAVADTSGWEAAFIATGAACVCALLLLWATYAPPPSSVARVQAPLTALSKREFKLVTLAGLLWMTGNGAYVVVLGFGPELLVERGLDPVEAGSIASLMPWAFLIALPLGAWTATRFAAPNIVIVASLFISAILGIWTAQSANALGFLGFGMAMAFGVATIATLPSEALNEASRSAGLGYYFMWYFVGSAAFPAFAGWIGDWAGTAAGPMIVAGAGQALCLLFFTAFRIEQRRAASS